MMLEITGNGLKEGRKKYCCATATATAAVVGTYFVLCDSE